MPRLHGFRGGTPLGGWASRVALLSLVGLGSLLVLPEDWHSQGTASSRSLQVLSQEEDDEAIKTGPFAELMRPHEMQPIWLLPLSNGIKQLLTFFVFGFDFKTKFKTGSARMKILSFCAGFVAKLAFIFLSLNSYVSDFRKFQSRKANNLDNLWQSALIFLAIWCTSHNFSAALGLWGSFTIQSPAVIFEDDIDRPRYLPASACWGFGAVEFPFFIGGARWLQFPKQIYALLLLPYVIPYMLLSYGTAILLVAWLILFTKCWCVMKLAWLVAAAVTCSVMYLFGSNQTGLQESWERIWPFVYLGGVQIYATYLVPPLIALLYGCLSCSSAGSIRRGLGLCKHEQDELEGEGDPLIDSCQNIGTEISHEMDAAQRDWDKEEGHHCECCAFCCVRLEGCAKYCAWLLPQRTLNIASDDRETLLRLDWSRLSTDFKFNQACMHHLAQYRHELDGVTEALHDFSPFDEPSSSDDEDSSCPTPYGKGCVDFCLGREMLFNYDVNERHAPSLRKQMKHENDENTIDDALIQVVLVTIRSISQIALQQTITIWLIRTLAASDFEGMIEAMRQTVTERTFDNYARHLATIGEQKLQQALNTVWGL
ncbi:unnamed protein product [Durusdinium trenchii]|uniref:Uncharacterized protein n=1 Tax=Durusdinium trenchii TaxID=1381693 RepID=A0ABP0I032_9DINO